MSRHRIDKEALDERLAEHLADIAQRDMADEAKAYVVLALHEARHGNPVLDETTGSFHADGSFTIFGNREDTTFPIPGDVVEAVYELSGETGGPDLVDLKEIRYCLRIQEDAALDAHQKELLLEALHCARHGDIEDRRLAQAVRQAPKRIEGLFTDLVKDRVANEYRLMADRELAIAMGVAENCDEHYVGHLQRAKELLNASGKNVSELWFRQVHEAYLEQRRIRIQEKFNRARRQAMELERQGMAMLASNALETFAEPYVREWEALRKMPLSSIVKM